MEVVFMSSNISPALDNMPHEIYPIIGRYLSFQDLNNMALTAKIGKIFANLSFDAFTWELFCSGETFEERKFELIKLYREASPSLINEFHRDIDKMKDKMFINGTATVEYDENSYTACFLLEVASKMFGEISNRKEITRDYEKIDGHLKIGMLSYYCPPAAEFSTIIDNKNRGLKITQTSSNSIFNMTNPKLLEVLKKYSNLFFKKLYDACQTLDINTENTLLNQQQLKTYKDPRVLVIKHNTLKLDFCEHMIILLLLDSHNFSDGIDILNSQTLTYIYGEKKDIRKFRMILYAQQFPNTSPSMTTLKKFHGIIN